MHRRPRRRRSPQYAWMLSRSRLFALSDPVQRAELVAVGIAQISKVEFPDGGFAYAWRFFARFAAMADAGRMPGIGLFGGGRGKADGAAIGRRRRLAVDRQ